MRKKLSIYFILSLSIFKAQNISTAIGTGTQGFSGDGGAATSAKIWNVHAIASDASGNLYITDGSNSRIRKINSLGIISTIAGYSVNGYSGDGGLATNAALDYPTGITLDGSGNIYFSDASNMTVRKINTSGIITTVAGNGTAGYSGDGGAATSAMLDTPWGIKLDALGNLYIADQFNSRVRKVSTTGIITTFAGTNTSGNSGDGGLATNAELNWPAALEFDGSGNLLIADRGANVVRKVNTSGLISTVVGTGSSGYTGDGGAAIAAQLYLPSGIEIDINGNIYISDNGNNVIRKINAAGNISTICGSVAGGYSGDGGPAINALLANPIGLEISSQGNLYIADLSNYRVRKIDNVVSVEEFSDKNQLIVSPNPTNGMIAIKTTHLFQRNAIEIYSSIGQRIFYKEFTGLENKIDLSTQPNGIYFIRIGSVTKKIIIE